MKLAIGQTGTLKGEVLTVTSSNEKFFTCDNGKTYVAEFSKWMTDGAIIVVKTKKAKKYNAAPDNYEQQINEKLDVREFEAMQEKSRMNQRGSWMR